MGDVECTISPFCLLLDATAGDEDIMYGDEKLVQQDPASYIRLSLALAS